MAPFLHVECLSHHSQCHCYHFIYCSAPLTFASYVMSRARQDIPSYYFYSLFFSFSFSFPSHLLLLLHHPLPHQFTFSIRTTCIVIEQLPTSRYLSFTPRFPCGVSIVTRRTEKKKEGSVELSDCPSVQILVWKHPAGR